ncbi:hypothetical protein PR202_gb10693 [Eleusine coracana subsp. coracana]|uniref:Uncharacterized protein n=1 Tax=Eleusine coracana subsp. coracana TaxID=191504 RepID=A0AAV5EKN5_ELECO|nr:hypothetical protein PR202_gb10693 [Eleusine coracana subsp. coracana]
MRHPVLLNLGDGHQIRIADVVGKRLVSLIDAPRQATELQVEASPGSSSRRPVHSVKEKEKPSIRHRIGSGRARQPRLPARQAAGKATSHLHNPGNGDENSDNNNSTLSSHLISGICEHGLDQCSVDGGSSE